MADDENRLKAVYPASPNEQSKKLMLTYDYMSRRVRKQVFAWTGSAWSSTAETDLRFVYDQWNVVEVLDGLDENAVKTKYTWGLDLSGLSGNATSAGIHGAGGIGGLLASETPQGEGDPLRHWYFYDANGNVGQVVDPAELPYGTIAAHYEYGPYGEKIVGDGAYADDNPFRFSTKWFDGEIATYYYGYRYYTPRLGRWLSRDPIGKNGGVQIVASQGFK